jgi:tRNA pseudouridine38-40 synthase
MKSDHPLQIQPHVGKNGGETTMRTRLDISYLGTPFHGWQVQERNEYIVLRTIQGEVEGALGMIYGCPIRIHGAGRTDAGVHATGQVAHFDLAEGARAIPPLGLQRAMNGKLPPEIRITAVLNVSSAFHARRSAVSKTYHYRYRRGSFLPPCEGLIESLVREELDVDAMSRAAAHLIGRRDFAAFSILGSAVKTTVRTLFALDVEVAGPVLVITAVGDGFLRGMVRRLAGTLRDVGRGRTSPELVLTSPGPTAEAKGLTLTTVTYPKPFPASGAGMAG